MVFVLNCIDLFLGLLDHPHDMTTGDLRDTKVEAENFFYDLDLAATLVISSTCYRLHRSALFSVGGNYQGCEYHEGGQNHCGPSWRLLTTSTTTQHIDGSVIYWERVCRVVS